MYRDLAVFDAYVPTILLMFFLGMVVTWCLDRLLALTGIYRMVWHPSLFRASVLVCVCGLMAMLIY